VDIIALVDKHVQIHKACGEYSGEHSGSPFSEETTVATLKLTNMRLEEE
jgi:hypothetical protein